MSNPFAPIDSAEAHISRPAARLAIGASTAAVLLLASLNVLSPEFDPSWRMVSEYANGHYGWVLSLMFGAWGLSSCALAFAIRSEATNKPLKIGLGVLVLAGIGQTTAAVFDINQDALHNAAGALGMLGLPAGAMLISINLGRTGALSRARRRLLWAANLTWVSVVLLVATFALLTITFELVEGSLPTQAPPVLPAGVIGLVGWANRLLVVAHCAWVLVVAREALDLTRRASESEATSFVNSLRGLGLS